MHTRTRRTPFALICVLLMSLVGCKSGKVEEPPHDEAARAPVDEGVIFREGFSEQTLPGRLEATEPANESYPSCVGHIADAPTLEIRFDGDVPARIHVVAEVDTTLLIASADGVECDDNFDLHHPSIHKLWPSGSYKVYVGSAERLGEPFEYDLNFDHYDPARPIEGRPLPEPAAIPDAADANTAEADADAANDDE